MKTTVDIPDDLMQQVKAYAAESNRKVNDTIADLIKRGIATSSSPTNGFDPGEPYRIKMKDPLILKDIEAAIASGRDDTI